MSLYLMSFDLYLLGFRDGRSVGLPRRAVRQVFGDNVAWRDRDQGVTRYCSDDDGCAITFHPSKSDPARATCVSVTRPLALVEFHDHLLKVLQLGHVALLSPGETGPIIAAESTAAHLPADFLGPPVLVRSAAEIIETITHALDLPRTPALSPSDAGKPAEPVFLAH